MWCDKHGPGLPGRPSQAFRSFNPMYTVSTSSLGSPMRVVSYRSGGLSRRPRVEIPTWLDPSPEKDRAATPHQPFLPSSIPPFPFSPPAPVHKLPPGEPPPKFPTGFEPYPLPPSSHVTRSGPPSPTNMPPVYSDTGPIIPSFSDAQSASHSGNI